jgi:hypothetical protein
MSIMIPTDISPEVKSTAERRIFEWFRNSHQTDDWIVLHSLGISNHNRVIYGETDFFVLVPKKGVFALEVKGGRVKRKNGIWYFTNKYGKTSQKARGPFEQAKDSAFSIVTELKKRLDKNHRYLTNVFFGFGVMFPDIEYLASGIDEEQWQVFDSRFGSNVREFILQLADGAHKKWEERYGHLDSSKLPSSSDVAYLASLLRGDFDYAISMNIQLNNADEALIRLTKEQYRCLDQLDDNPRCLIQGSAGTGKTLLAIEEAKRATARGEKIALFCFNTILGEWLHNYFAVMPETLRPAYIGTFHRFMTQIVKNCGKQLHFPQTNEQIQMYYQKDLPEQVLLTIGDSFEKYDKIVVDEAQDLIFSTYLDVMNACLKKGLSRGKWIMFGDFSMQAIYADNKSGEEMKNMLEEFTSFIRFKLTVNCRNTKQIYEEIKTVTGFEAPCKLWTEVEGPPVNYITYSSLYDQRNKLRDLISRLYGMNIEAEKITILSPKKRESSVVSLLTDLNITNYQIPQGTNTAFCTIQAFKGLENTIIILTDIEDFSAYKLMYVGLSRARSGLYILESEKAAKEYQTLMQRRLFHE